MNLLQRSRIGIRDLEDFNYDTLSAPPIVSLLSQHDTKQIHDIVLDPRLNNKIKLKEEYFNQILNNRGFEFLGRGTNRIVYKYLDDQGFVLKVPLSEAGRYDNPAEMKNQVYIKPFCTKVFDVSQDGLIGLFERGELIRSSEIFYGFGDKIFEFYQRFLGKYIMADVGSEFRKNWVIRPGFGPVLADFPLIYQLDGNKLFCNEKDFMTGIPCTGQIDYDAGYNRLYCKKCGKQHFAKSLAKKIEEGTITKRKRESNMKFAVTIGDEKYVIGGVTSSSSFLDNTIRKNNKAKVVVENKPNTGSPKSKFNISFGDEDSCEQKVYSSETEQDNVDELLTEKKELEDMYKVIIELQDKYTRMSIEYNNRISIFNEKLMLLENSVVRDDQNNIVGTTVSSSEYNNKEDEYIPSENKQEDTIIESVTLNTDVFATYDDQEKETTFDTNSKVDDIEVQEENDEVSKFWEEERERLVSTYNIGYAALDKLLDQHSFDLKMVERLLNEQEANYVKNKPQSAPFKQNKKYNGTNSNNKKNKYNGY